MLTLQALAPAELADANGAIATESAVIAAGGGNVISKGGSSVIAPGGGNMKDGLRAVPGAALRLEHLDGSAAAAPTQTDALGEGEIALPHTTTPLVAAAYFQVGGQAYRLACLVMPDSNARTALLDPINTMIEATSHGALQRHPDAGIFGVDAMAHIRKLCVDNGLSADADDLEYNGKSQAARDGLAKYWKDEVGKKVNNGRDRSELQDFDQEVEAIASNP
jgi:hypothetical protein